jgi:GH24 family phage-related lysozyme (muramidase)
MVLVKDINTCETSAVRGLDQQLIDEINVIVPNVLVSIEDLNVAVTGSSVWPLMQPPAKEALGRAINERGTTLQVNSAYRTIAAQFMLFQQSQEGRCGVSLAARPGRSNHQSGLAVDIADNAGWRPFLELHGWQWFGPEDEVHFDFVGGGTQDIRGTAVLAFQRLWNRNNPNDLIPEDGLYGEQTDIRLGNSPAEGFPSQRPDESIPLAPGSYSLKCLGAIEGSRYLNGVTAEGRVELAPSAGGDFSGTNWEVVFDEPASAYRFKCLGTIEGPRYLNGVTAEGRVDLAPSAGGDFSGTNWEAVPVPDAPTSTYRFKCLGTIEGPRWLDGRTADGTVGLVDNIDLSGTQWQVEPTPSQSDNKTINEAGFRLVQEFEGYAEQLGDGTDRVRAYRDSGGVLTIGFGHTGPDVTEGLIITREQAEQLLRGDLQEAEDAVSNLVTVPLNENQFSALVSFVFNLGAGELEDSTLLELLNQGRYPEAADQFPRFNTVNGEPVEGLTRRREAERQLFLTPPAA